MWRYITKKRAPNHKPSPPLYSCPLFSSIRETLQGFGPELQDDEPSGCCSAVSKAQRVQSLAEQREGGGDRGRDRADPVLKTVVNIVLLEMKEKKTMGGRRG